MLKHCKKITKKSQITSYICDVFIFSFEMSILTQNENKFIMKNLKKLSRKELKNLKGLGSTVDEEYNEGENTYKCCSDPYTCGACSIGSNCPSGYFLRAC